MTPPASRAPWVRRVFRLPLTAARLRGELDAELGFHLQERVEELMAQGMDREDAEREVRRRFGDVEEYRRQAQAIDQRIVRRRGRLEVLDTVRRETRQAARALVRSPLFAAAAVLTLALGIGATTAIFVLLDRVVLRSLPYPNADRLVDVRSSVAGKTGAGHWEVSVAGYFEYRRHAHSFDALGAYYLGQPTLTGGDREAVRVPGAAVTASLVNVLGLRPALGRLITIDDDRPGAPGVVVLGHALWEGRYGGDPSIVGQTIGIEGSPTVVVGVMAADEQLPQQRVDLWLPLQMDSLAPAINDHSTHVIGRLKPGVTAAEAQRDLESLTARFPELFPSAYSTAFMQQYHFTADVIPTRDEVLGNIGRVLWVLLASVGLVLLIACANVTNLYLVRLQVHRREVAVRRALGASCGQLAWHFLCESVLLALLAGAAGLALAWAGVHLLLAVAPSDIPRLAEVRLDAASVLFAVLLSLAIGTTFGIVASARRREIDLGSLREGARSATASRGQLTTRDVLMVGQVALAVLLLAAAALLLQSFRHLRNVRPGFDTRRALTFAVALPYQGYQDYPGVETFYRRLAERLSGLPGVTSVGMTQSLPLDESSSAACGLVFLRDRPLAKGETAPCIPKILVSPSYFAAMRIPVKGHVPTWAEVEQQAAGVVLSDALAQRFWPGENAVGKQISNGNGPGYFRVVGVAGDVRGDGLDQPPTQAVYYPLIPAAGTSLWSPPRQMSVVVRTRSDHPEALTSAVRRAVAELDRNIPTANVRPLSAVVARSMARVSFATLLLGIAAAMALLLSAIGVYGVIAYVVSQRRGEIGVRIALGARPRQVSGRMVVQALRLGAAGTVLGVAAALATTRVLRSLLVGVAPTDANVLIAVAIVVLAVVALASYWPARRAANVSPVEALRAE